LAADATTLATPRAINGVNFDGSAAITVTAAAGTLSGGTLNSGVTASSLTSVGTLTSVTTSGDLDVDGTANLDAVDIDGNVNLAGYLDMYNSLYITRADNSAGLQLICTDEDAGSGPLILLDRDTDSPANGDDIGKIYSQGRNDADQLVTYSQISTKAIDVADGTEDGQMLFNIMVNGTSTTVLDLYGPEIEMNTTLVDMNANLDVSGTATLTGAVTASGGITSTAASNTLGATSFNDAAITNVGDIALDSVSSDGSTAPHFLGTGSSGATEIGNAVDNAGLFIRSKTGTGAGMAIGTTSGGDAYLQGCFNDNSGGKTIILNPYGDNVQVTGALSKGSGSFLIPHPLPSMNDTHNLVHSFVEGPRADLIYRGSVALSGGSASVDLDEEVGLTDGTWELLCRDPQVFLQNDTGWAALKGVVSGSTLIITCKDTTSFDTISWLVVAERQDDHMKDPSIDWTDDDGRPILEPLKRQGTVA